MDLKHLSIRFFTVLYLPSSPPPSQVASPHTVPGTTVFTWPSGGAGSLSLQFESSLEVIEGKVKFLQLIHVAVLDFLGQGAKKIRILEDITRISSLPDMTVPHREWMMKTPNTPNI